MSIPKSVVSPDAAFAYIAARLRSFSTKDGLAKYPDLTAEAVAECVAIAEHFLSRGDDQ
jgi:hypothetical protein